MLRRIRCAWAVLCGCPVITGVRFNGGFVNGAFTLAAENKGIRVEGNHVTPAP